VKTGRLSPGLAVEVFAVSNLAFLGVDIAVAHGANHYARSAEWVPLGFSALATLLLAPGLAGERVRARMRPVAIAVAAGSVAIGLAGMIYHLQSGFFREQTLHALVYAAPFAAPLAYVGVGLLVLLSRLESPESKAWSAWVTFLALGGFAGNFVLSLTDHAQNGFFQSSEWIAVGAAALAVGFLLLAVLRPRDRPLLRICLFVLVFEALVGLAGEGLHWIAIVGRPGPGLVYRVIFGPPAFAPLLYVDLAVLAAIGIWSQLACADAR